MRVAGKEGAGGKVVIINDLELTAWVAGKVIHHREYFFLCMQQDL